MLRAEGISKSYGARVLFDRVDFTVGTRERVGLVGRNGAGKTTLLRTVSGLVRPRAGEIALEGRDVVRENPERIVALGCSHVPEGRQVFASMSVLENLLMGAHVQVRRGRKDEVKGDLERIFRLFPVLGERQRQFAEAPVRRPLLAGGGYPSDAAALREAMCGYMNGSAEEARPRNGLCGIAGLKPTLDWYWSNT